MSGLFQKKEKLHREPVRWKKELKLAPGYLILTLWILFTLALLGWVLLASFSTTKEIFSNKLLDSGFHIENYVKAWVNSNVSTIFFNSLFYAAVSCTLLILICAPAAYALSRFDFVCNKLIQSSLVASMGVPVVMIVLPLFAVVAGLNILNNVSANRATLIFLYIGINVPYTTIFLTTFFANLSRAFEEAAAIDGCGIYGCFFRIALPLCRTGFFVSGLMTFINNWNELLLAMVFISDPMKKTLPVTLTYFVGPYATNYVQMFAAIIIAIAPTVVVYSLFSNQIVEGLTTGAVKG